MKILVCGKEYKIDFNFGVLKEVCEECKCNTPTLMQKLAEGDLIKIASVIKHGILSNHADFDVEQINKMPIGEVISAIEVISKLVVNSMPKVKDAQKKIN